MLDMTATRVARVEAWDQLAQWLDTATPDDMKCIEWGVMLGTRPLLDIALVLGEAEVRNAIVTHQEFLRWQSTWREEYHL